MISQTKLSYDELVAVLNGESQRLPRCRAINELGMMADGQGDQSKAAEQKLVELLSSENEEDRWISIRYLLEMMSSGKNVSTDTKNAVAIFQKDPSNADILPNKQELAQMHNAS